MASIFPRWATPVSRLALVLALVGGLLLAAWLVGWVEPRVRVTRHLDPAAQPMWFDHRHHVTGFEVDCRYCHYTADRSRYAGLPSTGTCVPCHNETWLSSRYFAPVRRSLEEELPLRWRRVHDVPDFVFFDHSIHVNKGVGCETCHGRVDRMPLVRQVESLSMGWCLECHRDPGPYLRPVEEVTTMGWEPDGPREALAVELMARYDVRSGRPITTCSACHR